MEGYHKKLSQHNGHANLRTHKLTQAYKTRKCWNFSNDNLNSNLECEKKKCGRFRLRQNKAHVCFRVRKSIQVKNIIRAAVRCFLIMVK